LVVASLAALSGCGSGDEATDSASSSGLPKEIVIGAAIAKTGYMAPYDESFAAIEELVRETNADGGIDGHKLRVIHADTRSDPQQAVVATQKLIDQGADVLFFSAEALTAAASAAPAEEGDMLNFAVVNEPGYGPPTGSRLSFSSNPSLLSEVSAAASFLREKGLQHPFLFRDTSLIYSKAACSGFEQAWEKLGGSTAGSVDFKNEDESVASQVSELESSDADAVIMCSYPPGGAAAVKQIRAAGIDLPIYGPSAFDGTFWLKGIPDVNNIYVTSNASAYDPPDAATARVIKHMNAVGINTDYANNLVAAYAGGQLMIAALREVGDVNGEALASALEAKPHRTILGRFSYAPDNHYPRRTWPIYRFVNGKERLVTKVRPTFIPEYGR
jgi:branched-chain amino acid transport system substrate-binding protein